MVEVLPVESNLDSPYARTAMRVHRIRALYAKEKGKGQPETAYYLTSLSMQKANLSTERAAGRIRGH